MKTSDDHTTIQREFIAPQEHRTNPRVYVFIAIIIAALIGVNFDPNVRGIQEQVLGSNPLGLPATVVFTMIELAILFPLLWMVSHFLKIVWQSQRDGDKTYGPMGFMRYLLVVGRRHPELRRSQAICTFGVFYFFAVVAAWIVYAESRGI